MSSRRQVPGVDSQANFRQPAPEPMVLTHHPWCVIHVSLAAILPKEPTWNYYIWMAFATSVGILASYPSMIRLPEAYEAV